MTRHRHRTLALALALALAGCVQQQESPPIAEALPTADAVRVNVPQNNIQQYALGQIADYYVLTRQISRDFNAGAAWVLIVVHTIVQYPPTTVDGDTYTWGPHSDALDPAEWRLVVTANGDGTYAWQLDGRSKTAAGAEWKTIIIGDATPGTDPHRGSGSFTLDFDAAEEVNPIDNDARGQVSVIYDLENRDDTQATISMHIESTQPGESGELEPVNADYFYGENLDGSGDFQFSLHADLEDEGGTAFEDAVIRSRWQADGAGRADASISGGDLGDGTSVLASECWDVQFRRVYYADSVDWQPTEGESASCVYADQLLPSL